MNEKNKVSVIITTFNRKDQVSRCIDSVLKSDFNNLEVIVVDNHSSDNTTEVLRQKYKNDIKVIQGPKNLFAGGGRNLGAESASGQYLLFIDSDNIISKEMIKNLASYADAHINIGILGPLMFYKSNPEILWWAGADIDKFTSKTTYRGHNQRMTKKFMKIISVGHVPNVMLIPSRVFRQIKGFDTINFPMHYEESDIAERIRKLGYLVLRIPKAVTYHDTPLKLDNNQGEGLALNDKNRAYYNIRNRILFMKKYGTQYSIFVMIFLPMFTLLYIYMLSKIRRFDLIKYLLLGVKDGLSDKKV